MKNLTKALLLTVTLLLILFLFIPVFLSPTYIMMRFHPDLTVRTDFLEPYFLTDDKWSTLEQISYENGQPSTRSVICKTLFTNYTAKKINISDNTELLSLYGKSDCQHERYDHAEGYPNSGIPMDNETPSLYVRGDMMAEGNGSIVSYILVSGKAYGEAGKGLNDVKIVYGDDGKMVRQTRYEDLMVENGYVTYQYDEKGRCIRPEEFGKDGMLLAMTEYVYDGRNCHTTTYASDGTVQWQTDIKTNVLGQLSSRRILDSRGNLVSQEQYHYRFWEVYSSFQGILVLILAALFSIAMGFGLIDVGRRKKKA